MRCVIIPAMNRPWLFDLGAFLYGTMTAQKTWRSSCALLATHFPELNNARLLRVLDLGCGPGVSTITLAKACPGAMFVGLDLAPRMLREAKRYTARAVLTRRIDYVLADATHLPFADSSWDIITGHSFLYLISNRSGVLAEAYRVLKHGGIIASMEPHAGWVDMRGLLHHWRDMRYLVSVSLWRLYSRLHVQFTSDSFQNLLTAGGFQKTATEITLDGLGIIGIGEKP